MPPHLPFYGNKGFKWMKNEIGKSYGNSYLHVQQYGKIKGWDIIQKYYSESIEKALTEIFTYKWIYDHHTVITADHGEIIGEGNGYGHSQFNRDTPLLRIVPWHTVSEGLK